MSLRKNTSPVRPPSLPPLAPLHPNTNAGVHLASAMSNSASLLNANVESVDDAFLKRRCRGGGNSRRGRPLRANQQCPLVPNNIVYNSDAGGEGGDNDGARSADANLGSIFPSATPTLNLRYYNQNSELNDESYDSKGGLPHFADEDEGADPEGYNEAPLNSAADALNER